MRGMKILLPVLEFLFLSFSICDGFSEGSGFVGSERTAENISQASCHSDYFGFIDVEAR